MLDNHRFICDLPVANNPAPAGCSCVGTLEATADGDNLNMVRVAFAHCLRDGLALRAWSVSTRLSTETSQVVNRAIRTSEGAGTVKIHHGEIDGTVQWLHDRIMIGTDERNQGTYSLAFTIARDVRPIDVGLDPYELGRCHPLRREHEQMVDVAGGDQVVCSRTLWRPIFRIDRDLVSAESYQVCLNAGVCPDDGSALLFGGPAVTSYVGAARYCSWRGARLPSVLERYRAHDIAWPLEDNIEWADDFDCTDGAPNGRYAGLSQRGTLYHGPPLQAERHPPTGSFRCARP